MAKHVKSNDPRKPAIVAALKKASGGTKITLVKEIGPNTFEGEALAPGRFTTLGAQRKFVRLGRFTVTFGGVNPFPSVKQ